MFYFFNLQNVAGELLSYYCDLQIVHAKTFIHYNVHQNLKEFISVLLLKNYHTNSLFSINNFKRSFILFHGNGGRFIFIHERLQ